MANNKPFIVKSGLVPQTHNDQDLGHATSKFANAHISNLAGAVQINSAFTLPTADGTAEQVIKTDGAGNLSFTTISTNFLGLTDVTPNSFTGQAGKVVSVNTAENAVEFVDISTDFLGLTDVTPNSFTGQAGKVVQVNTLENAIEFVDLAAVTFSDAAPSTPQSGDLWFDSGTNAELFIWTGTEWISTTGGDQAAFTMRDFTGDNTTTVFSTGVGSNVSAFVYLNGVLLKETTDYSFANGDVTFVTAPFLNDVIQVMLHGQAEYLTLGTLGGSTDDVTEGSTNLYYTDARVQTKLGNISGHILPDTNDTYDIGSASLKIRDLYLGSNTLHIGDADITSTGTKVELPTGSTIGGAEAPQVNLSIAPETLEIQVDAPDMGQATMWKWTWEQSTLPYARRTITNSNELNVPLYKEGTYVVNNFAAYDIHGSMTQTHSLYLKWVDGAGTDNLVSWATSAGPISDSHPDINGGNATDVQRITVSVPATITPPTLNNPSVAYTVTNNSAGAYTFSGSAMGDNPNIGPMYRGGTYTFNLTATGHPFYLTTDNGTNFSAGTYFGEYTTGVTGSRNDTGSVTFTVPANAPDTLYYQCGNHSAMRGEITVKDLALETNVNGNYVIYFQHTQEGHRTPVELRPIPSLVNQMCLVYDNTTNRFVPQDLATYVENTPSFENKIREVAGTAELVVEDGSAVIAKVTVYDDSTYLPLTGNNPGDQAFATDTNILYIWDGSAWQQAGGVSSVNGEIGDVTLTNADDSFWTHVGFHADLPTAGANNHGMLMHVHEAGRMAFVHDSAWVDLANRPEVASLETTVASLLQFDQNLDTDDVAEATNLFYTDARVRNVLTTDGIATTTYVDTQVANIVDSAPATLDTLNELAAALGDDPNFATTISTQIGNKADKTIDISAGTGLTGGGDLTANRTISHADTSTLTGAQTGTSGQVVSGMTVDGFGHVSAIAYASTISNSATADALSTARTITLSGEVTGSASFDGSGNINIDVDVLGGTSDNSGTADNANTLDGLDSTYFLDASNMNAGTLPDARLSDNVVVVDTQTPGKITLTNSTTPTSELILWATGGTGQSAQQGATLTNIYAEHYVDGTSKANLVLEAGTGSKIKLQRTTEILGNIDITYTGAPHISTGRNDANLRIANNSNNSSSGNSINMFGETQGGTWEGDIHYVASGVGSSGGHKFWNWNGSGWEHTLNLTSDGKLGLGDNAGNYFAPTNKLHIKDGSIRLQASQQTSGDYSQSVGIRWSQETDGEVAYIKVDRPSWAYAPSDMKFAVRDTTNAPVEKLELRNDGALHNLAGGFFSGYTSASNTDGDLNQPFRLDADRSAWSSIFGPSWQSNNGWGIFWAGDGGAAYQYGWDSSNPNECVFVGSGTTRASIHLTTGDAYFAGEVLAASDERLKDNIKPIDDALDIVLTLEGKRYTKDGKEQIGVIAQQVEKVLPEVVTTPENDGMKSVNYGNMVAVLIEAIKDQQIQIDELRRQINGN